MVKARKTVEQLIIEKNRDKYMRGDKSQAIRPEKLNFPGGNPESVIYDVEMNPPNPFIQIKPSFMVFNPYRYTKRSQEKSDKVSPIPTLLSNISLSVGGDSSRRN